MSAEAGSQTKRVGVMGGTFDPIHHGHLAAAEAVKNGFHLERVIFVPAGYPPHKDIGAITDARTRYVMVVLATNSNPDFEVSTIEMDRPGPSYTIDTIKALAEQLGHSTQLYFITGADAVLEICGWKNVESLLEMCEFIAVTRPGYNLSSLEQLKEKIGPGRYERIHVFEVPALAISSSELRRRVKEGRSVKYLVPEAVEQYIKKNRLYLDSRN